VTDNRRNNLLFLLSSPRIREFHEQGYFDKSDHYSTYLLGQPRADLR